MATKKLTTDNLPHIFTAVKNYVEGRISDTNPGGSDAEEATEQDVQSVADSIFNNNN